MNIRKIYLQPLGSWLAIALLTCAALAQGRGFTIQIASATSEAEAQAVINELQAKGVEPHLVKAVVPGKGTRYRVRVSHFNSLAEARAAGDRLLSRGAIAEFAVMTYDPPLPAAAVRKNISPAVTEPPLPSKEPQHATPAKTTAPDIEASSERGQDNDNNAALKVAKDVGKDAAVSPSDNVAAAPAEASKETPPLPAPVTTAEKSLAPPRALPVASPVAKPSAVPSAAAHSLDHASNPAEPAKTEPKIAAPPVADALADFSFSNQQWKVVRRSAETDKNLRAIHFVDALTGWAAGDAGAVYRTTDGGRTWKPLLSGAAADINFVQFVDWNNGWMLGAAINEAGGTADESGRLLFSTNNGGRTWTSKSLPNVLSIHFTDAKNGWAVGRNATVLRTTDGGAEWQAVAGLEKLVGLPVESSNYRYGFRDIFFLNTERGQRGQLGWMIGNFYGHERSHIGGLFATEDGGQTWRRMPFTLQTQYTSGRFTPGLLHSVRFSDANTGSVTGEMTDGEGRFFFVLHTRDGGKTWEQFRTPSRAAHSTQFLNLTSGWMAAFAPREGAAEAVVYDTTLLHTDNGGMSWQSDFTARGRRIHGLFFLSPTKGWAVGDRGTILRYEDKKSHAPD